jgi:hypothetical protein
LDIAAFRAAFAEFADAEEWPDALLLSSFAQAREYISAKPGGRLGSALELALWLMTAHLAALAGGARGAGQGIGGSGGCLVSGASVDKVSVTLTPPPVKSQWQWWMSLTPRGAQLLALLKSKAAGGLYVGGLPAERAAFRKAGGVFVNAASHT